MYTGGNVFQNLIHENVCFLKIICEKMGTYCGMPTQNFIILLHKDPNRRKIEKNRKFTFQHFNTFFSFLLKLLTDESTNYAPDFIPVWSAFQCISQLGRDIGALLI